MNTNIKFMLAVVAGAAIGGTAVQELHAQAKPKAYSITESEILDPAAMAAYTPLVTAAVKAAGGRSLRTGGGKTIAYVGSAPIRVVINEWDSLAQQEAFRNSAAWKNLAPQREKAQKIIRAYVVEAVN